MNRYHFPLFLQVFRFGVVGLAAAAVHFSIVVGLVQTLALAPLIANVFAFLISFQLSYWGHRVFTFNDTMTLHREAYPRLIVVQCLNFCANESLFYLFLSLHFPYPVALFIVLTVLPIFTFISSKWWVFR